MSFCFITLVFRFILVQFWFIPCYSITHLYLVSPLWRTAAQSLTMSEQCVQVCQMCLPLTLTKRMFENEKNNGGKVFHIIFASIATIRNNVWKWRPGDVPWPNPGVILQRILPVYFDLSTRNTFCFGRFFCASRPTIHVRNERLESHFWTMYIKNIHNFLKFLDPEEKLHCHRPRSAERRLGTSKNSRCTMGCSCCRACFLAFGAKT